MRSELDIVAVKTLSKKTESFFCDMLHIKCLKFSADKITIEGSVDRHRVLADSFIVHSEFSRLRTDQTCDKLIRVAMVSNSAMSLVSNANDIRHLLELYNIDVLCPGH